MDFRFHPGTVLGRVWLLSLPYPSLIVLFSLVGGIPVPGEDALRPLTFEQLSLIFQFGTYWTISLGCAGLNGATVNDNEQRSGARAQPHCTPHSNHPAKHFRLLPLTSGVSLPVLSPCLLWAFCHKDDCVCQPPCFLSYAGNYTDVSDDYRSL